MSFKKMTLKTYPLLLFFAVEFIMSSCANKAGDKGSSSIGDSTEYQETPDNKKNIVFPKKTFGVFDNEGGQDSSPSSSSTEKSKVILKQHTSAIEIPVMLKNVPNFILKRYAYTMSYNKSTRCPNWVAWKLTGNHTYGSYKRKNYNFHEDMDVPSPRAKLHDYSYNGLGLERGHMCPAGDNKWSDRAMDECHLLSNICPQYGKLNGGAWKYLEEDCRDWAEAYNCIYIVCGPIFYGKTHGTTIGEDKIAVPDAFFKVILRLGNKPQALGFIYPNRKCSGGKSKYVMSVDKVEEIVGMDFFSSLDDNVENKVEQSSNLNLWR
jgi:endonuclease G